ncbi:histidine kinase [Desulfolithobacter sp.]
MGTMKTDWQLLGPEGLAFFGKITASLSHELKNVLAIINENSGLIEDYMLMADSGTEIDPERLSGLAARIDRQVERANGLVNRLNAFAHSVDHPVQDVDIGQLLELAAKLSHRILSGYGVEVEIIRAETVQVTTSPFFLLNLVCNCLFALGSASASGTVLGLCCTGGDEGRAVIQLRGASVRSGSFPGPSEQALLRVLEACLEDAPEGEGILILLPGK